MSLTPDQKYSDPDSDRHLVDKETLMEQPQHQDDDREGETDSGEEYEEYPSKKRQNRTHKTRVRKRGEIPRTTMNKKDRPKNKAHPVNLNGGDAHQLIMTMN